MTFEPDPVRQVRTLRSDEVTTVVEQPVVTQPRIVEQRVAPAVVSPQGAVVHERVATSSGRRYAVDSVLVALVGLALMIVGLIAITRAGVDGPMDRPVVQVLGASHTATLGIIEAAIGLCLLISAALTSKSGAIFFGLVLGIGGVVGAVQADSFRRSLALESGFAWLCVVGAIIVVLASLLIPRMATRTSRIEAI